MYTNICQNNWANTDMKTRGCVWSSLLISMVIRRRRDSLQAWHGENSKSLSRQVDIYNALPFNRELGEGRRRKDGSRSGYVFTFFFGVNREKRERAPPFVASATDNNSFEIRFFLFVPKSYYTHHTRSHKYETHWSEVHTLSPLDRFSTGFFCIQD